MRKILTFSLRKTLGIAVVVLSVAFLTALFSQAQEPSAAENAAVATEAAGKSSVEPVPVMLPAPDIETRLKAWTKALDEAQKVLDDPKTADEALETLRTSLAKTRSDAGAAVAEITPLINQARAELDALGPAPAEGALAEAPAVAEKRKGIASRVARLEGQAKQSALLETRADSQISAIAGLRRSHFKERILARGLSPLSVDVWSKAGTEVSAYVQVVRDKAAALSQDEAFQTRFAESWKELAASFVLAILLAWPLRRYLLRRVTRGLFTFHDPSYSERMRTAVTVALVRILAPTAGVGALYLALLYSELMTPEVDRFVRLVLGAFVLVLAVMAFCRAALAPWRSQWRLVHVHDRAALAIYTFVSTLAVFFAVDQVIDALAMAFNASLELTLSYKFLSGLFVSVLLFLLVLRRQVWERGDGTRPFVVRLLRLLSFLLVIAIPVTALSGYVALSRLLATQSVLTLALLPAIQLARRIAEELIDHVFSRRSGFGLAMRQNLGMDDHSAEMASFWIGTLLSLSILTVGGVSVLLLWGAGGGDFYEWLYRIFTGFQIGGVTISISGLLAAIGLFVAAIVLARMLQRFLDTRLFPRTRMDIGLRHSLRAAVGYIGFLIGIVLAIAELGVDTSNLAIIAGALSVGIGFGMQNIISNFVSGLILLAERPIKVGDWVVVGDRQGHVRRISVRATEVQTFDRASLFIPNSELISGPVVNLTHADKVGRVVIPVGVAYGSDIVKVRDVLMALVKVHHDVLPDPEPAVFMLGFGDSALNFEVRAFVNDVDRVKAITSDLCFAIDAAFREEGITIPFPQREITIRNLADLKSS